MLICMNCNVEYEEGRKFCKYCGESLIPKIEPMSNPKKGEGIGEGKLDGKLICPNCKINYEFGSSCIQCGSVLVPNLPSWEGGESKANHQEAKEEKENFQPQTPQGQQTKKSHHQLICPACQIIYEKGDSCIKCGSNLVLQLPSQTKEELKEGHEPDDREKSIPLQPNQEPLIEAPRKKIICPTCKIIYEREGNCIRCGLTLVTQLPFQEGETPNLSEPPSVEVEPTFFQPPQEKSSEVFEEAKTKEIEIHPTPDSKIKKETLPPGPLKQPPISKLGDELERRSSFQKNRKIDYRRLSMEIGSVIIMALAGGYIFWSIFSHTNKEMEAKSFHSKENPTSVLLSSSKTTSTTSPAPMPKESKDKVGGVPSSSQNANLPNGVFSETGEIEKIKRMLENIRQANLKKDIDLFLSCYSTDFKDRELKKKATLDNWKKFDYLNLTYDLKNPSISGDTVRAKVEWLIKFFPTTGGASQESKSLLDVLLKKEEGEWKIKEVKLVG
ncbi:MAG: zinc ribbon domain-containing protein [Syntrophaceae bacterium]|nr:zinc ribbon domain-containing protein [Syntrophaceae bacterium]